VAGRIELADPQSCAHATRHPDSGTPGTAA
jgi:hypothetical protein